MKTSGILWRDTARPVRVGPLDARALTGLIVWALHMCMLTFCFSCLVIAVFVLLERFGVTPPAAWRFLRQQLVSPVRPNTDPYILRKRLHWE